MLGTELLSMDLATDTPSDDTLVATYSEEEDKKFEITVRAQDITTCMF